MISWEIFVLIEFVCRILVETMLSCFVLILRFNRMFIDWNEGWLSSPEKGDIGFKQQMKFNS